MQLCYVSLSKLWPYKVANWCAGVLGTGSADGGCGSWWDGGCVISGPFKKECGCDQFGLIRCSTLKVINQTLFLKTHKKDKKLLLNNKLLINCGFAPKEQQM